MSYFDKNVLFVLENICFFSIMTFTMALRQTLPTSNICRPLAIRAHVCLSLVNYAAKQMLYYTENTLVYDLKTVALWL